MLTHQVRSLENSLDALEDVEGRLDLMDLTGIVQEWLEGFFGLMGTRFRQGIQSVQSINNSWTRLRKGLFVERINAVGTAQEERKVFSNHVL